MRTRNDTVCRSDLRLPMKLQSNFDVASALEQFIMLWIKTLITLLGQSQVVNLGLYTSKIRSRGKTFLHTYKLCPQPFPLSMYDNTTNPPLHTLTIDWRLHQPNLALTHTAICWHTSTRSSLDYGPSLENYWLELL